MVHEHPCISQLGEKLDAFDHAGNSEITRSKGFSRVRVGHLTLHDEGEQVGAHPVRTAGNDRSIAGCAVLSAPS